MPYATVASLPAEALGQNGRPAVMLAPASDNSEFRAAPASSAMLVTNLKVFKAGTFRDSEGRLNTWTTESLRSMVNNFDYLVARGLLPNVPIRMNHTRDVKDVIGYYKALRVSEDGQFLLADIEFTSADAKTKYDEGTFRNRSIEIGTYETNSGDFFFPTVLGLAFCDIPAVEGLFAASLSAYAGEKPEFKVYAAEAPAPAAAPTPGAPAPTPGAVAPATPTATTDFEGVLTELRTVATQVVDNPDIQIAVQKVIQAVEAIQAGATTTPPSPATSNAHQGDLVETFKFTLDGRDIDIAGDDNTKQVFTALATTATTLRTENEQLKTEREAAVQAARTEKVDAWLHAKKITPAQVDGMKAYVATLSDEQFIAHTALVEGTPVLSFTAPVGPSGSEQQDDDKAAQIKSHTATFSMLKAAGLSAEKLAESKPAKALIALGASLPE